MRIRLTCLLSLLALVACSILTAGASAIVLQLPEGRVGYQPPRGQSGAHTKQKSASSKTLTYHGGPVMTSNTNFPLYWAPAGEGAYPAGYISGIDRWFSDLAHDSAGLLNTDSVLTQYGDKEGGFANYNSHFGGAQIDTDPYPVSGCKAATICLTKEQLEAEVRGYAEAHALPADLAHEYFVLTPPGVSTCFEAAGHACSQETAHFKYCAYHASFKVGGATYIWADNPYVDTPECVAESPNESPSDYAISGGLAHEHSESVTDPEISGWYNEKEEEVADKCRSANLTKELGTPLGTAPDGAPYNQLINGDEYLYQQMWSNERAACEQRDALPPTVKKISPKKGPTSGGTHVTITGGGFTGSVSVYFGSTPATEVKVANGESLTAVSPPGTEEVAVTVHTAAGSSPASKKTSFKYKAAKKGK
ncbi:MAG TPA: IPT/TIG domain-containing protein [Solirubrobacteraceae bacterium]|nr:IPT/TIG domain-containing protein [Solirubrobacteraceae bacterium]